GPKRKRRAFRWASNTRPHPNKNVENAMPDLIPPHGGLTEPINRTVPADEIGDFVNEAAALKRVPVSDADLSTLYRIGDGGLSPLKGAMDRAAFQRVLDDEIILHYGKAYAW